jgi:hypothetical protein|tara:strand:+ start:5280 stop:5663 length:384 start_codon:yes stop_codon:yes gene_type:complete
MKEFGKNLGLKKRINPLDEKELFCEIVDLYEEAAIRGTLLDENTGINLMEYDEDFYIIIENLFYLKYGEWKTEIVTWYVWERKDIVTGEIGVLEWTNEDTDETKEVIIKCAKELWDLLTEIDNAKNK